LAPAKKNSVCGVMRKRRLRAVRNDRDTSCSRAEGFHAVVERRAVDAEQACRLTDVAVRSFERGLDVVALGFGQRDIEVEWFGLPQALASRGEECAVGAA
jgi:hypothetical protein